MIPFFCFVFGHTPASFSTSNFFNSFTAFGNRMRSSECEEWPVV